MGWYGKIQVMNNGSESLPNDLELLKKLVIQQREELILQQAQLEQKSDYINQLIEAIALARQQYFGSRGQKVDTESTQLSWLFNEAEAIADHDAVNSNQDEGKSGDKNGAPRKRGKGGRKKLPDHFPRIEIIHTLDEADCHCDHCQGQLIEMSHKSSEQLELIPMTVKVIKHIKKTYHCPRCNQGIKAATLPPQPIPGSIASAATIAHIGVAKYVNSMPLYRQAQDFKRLEIPLTASTLARWMASVRVIRVLLLPQCHYPCPLLVVYLQVQCRGRQVGSR